MIFRLTIAAAALLATAPVLAGLSAEEMKELGTTLTPWGAIKAGNKDGSIPAYDGGIPATTTPPGYKKDSGHWPNPFATEKPLYSITAKNMAQYDDKLSDAMKELLRRYPTFRMDVYPTHRVVNYKKPFIDATLKNAERCHTVEEGMALKGCIGGLAFPIPKTGAEAMWNILTSLKPDGHSVIQSMYIDATGVPVISVEQELVTQYPYFNSQQVEEFEKDGSWLQRYSTLQKYPPRIAGDGNTYWWSADPVNNPTKGWGYQQGNRRIRSLPDPQYDYPILVSGGAMFFDETNLFTGKLDRFDWKLLGKKEMLIPYNNYRFAYEATKDDFVKAGGGHHPNPDVIRWELHRVNVIEGTLKPGSRHAYAKRRYYIDEDYPSFGMADSWDHAGKIYKGYYSMGTWLYDYQTAQATSMFNYDLSTGITFIGLITGGTPGISVSKTPLPNAEISPDNMQRRSAR